jgi:hypothetical protein
MSRSVRIGFVVTTMLAVGGVLGFWGALSADEENAPPFNTAVAQRDEMIRELREIKALLKEQNDLFRKLLEPAGDKSKGRR